MPVTTQVHGHVLVIRIEREEKRNAIDQATSDGLEQALDLLEGSAGLRAGVLTGTPRIFSAGTDLASPVPPRTERGGEYGVIRRQRRVPLVAAVEGWALGGGFELAMACDLVVASTEARFGLPEVSRGLVATSGALFRTARSLPRHIARDLLLTGEPIDAQRAYELGLVATLCPPGTAEAAAIGRAEAIARNSPSAVQATLEALDTPWVTEAEGWRLTEAAMARIAETPDKAEGIAAFLERRPPIWS